jgi:uncharacterized protein YukE
MWDDVILDVAAARAAVEELRAAAAAVEQQGRRRADLALDAQASWQGQQRVRFDAELELLLQDAADLIAALLAAAGRIEEDLDVALAEQRRRVAARADDRRDQQRLAASGGSSPR